MAFQAFDAKTVSKEYSVGIDRRQNFFRTMFFGHSLSGFELTEEYLLMPPVDGMASCANLGAKAEMIPRPDGVPVRADFCKIYESASYNEILRRSGFEPIMGGVGGLDVATCARYSQNYLEQRAVAREDWMCAQLLTQGVVIATDAAGNRVDGGVKVWTNPVIGTGATWATATAADDPIVEAEATWSTDGPDVDLLQARNLGITLGTRRPDILVLGAEASLIFETSDKVRAGLDVRGLDIGALNLNNSDVFQRDSVVPLGKYLGYTVYSCLDARMPTDAALITVGTSQAGRSMRYAWQDVPRTLGGGRSNAERLLTYDSSVNPVGETWLQTSFVIPYSPWKWNAIVVSKIS